MNPDPAKGALQRISLAFASAADGEPSWQPQDQSGVYPRVFDQSGQHYGKFVSEFPAAIYLCDTSGRIKLYNDAAVQLWGREPKADELWCGWYRFYYPDGSPMPPEDCPLARVLTGKALERSPEIMIERPDGTRRHIITHPKPILDDAGNIIGAINMLVDITDRKEVENELAATRDDLTQQVRALTRLHELALTLNAPLALENTLQTILECIVDVSSATYGLLSLYDAEAGVLRPFSSIAIDPASLLLLGEITPGLDSGCCGASFMRRERTTAEDAETDPLFERCRAVVRSLGFRSVHSTPIVKRSGEILGVLSLMFAHRHVPTQREMQMADLCARHAADVVSAATTERALEESERRFRAIADSAPVILGMTDSMGRSTFLSRGWYEFTGQNEDEGAGFGWMAAVHPEDAEKVRATFEQHLASQDAIAVDFRLRRKDGEYRWVAGSGRARRSIDGRLIGFIGSLTDITPRKLAEEMLRNANNELEERVAERTGALRALALELTQTEGRERKRLARVLHDNVQQLLAAIKMQAGIAMHQRDFTPMREVMRLSAEAINACRTLVLGLSPPVLRDTDLANTLAWLSATMGEHYGLHVELTTEEVPQIPEEYRTLIFEVTRELLFNVVKHSGVNSATLQLARNNGHIWVEVADKGKGCDPAQLERPGTNSFGLFSIRERLAGVGGALTADGKLGAGCRVRITIPVSVSDGEISNASPPAAAELKEFSSDPILRVILVDDHQMLRQGLANALAVYSDIQVVAEASDGIEAMQLTRTFHPDVVVMDVSLPGINGIQATRRIRSEMLDVRIVGLSMYGHEEMAAAMFDAGADAYVCKGEPIEQLVDVLRAKHTCSTGSSHKTLRANMASP